MAISASQIATTNTLEQFRTEFNILRDDVSGLEDGSVTFTEITATSLGSSSISVREDGTIIFEGATDNASETTLTVVDPTADRTITFADETGTVHTSGGDTTHTNIIIADAGTIGSTSDTNAIGISSGGVISVTATTANTSATDGALTVAGGLGVAADVSIGDDLRLLSDSAVLSFGADSDTTLTHTDGSGLTLNSTNKIMFNDASQFIHAPSATVLDLAATDEIELTATLVDVVGNFAVSGTIVGASTLSATTGTFSGILKTDDATDATSTTDGSLQTDGGLSVAKDAIIGNDLKLLSDSAVLVFGAGSDATITHTNDVGLTLNSTNKLMFNDASQYIQGASATVLDIAATDEIELTATLIDIVGRAEISGNLSVGGDLDVTGSLDMSDANLTNVGSIALDSISGDADSNTSITFSGSDIITFATGGSTAATLNASQVLTLSGNMIIPDAGTIGSASDTNAIAISSGGVVSVTATTANTSASDGALTVAGGAGISADLSVGDDVRLISDAAVLSFGADSEVTLTHVADTGILLNGTNVIQFNDASQNIGAPSNAILDINATDEIELNATLLDVNANLDVSGTIVGASTGTFSGILKTDDTTAATTTTDGSLQTDGGLSVAADAVIGDDLFLLSDAAVLTFGADKDVTLTHVHNTGVLLNGTNVIQFNDASQNIGAPSNAILDINATDEIELNATLIDINGNVEISGTTSQVGVSTSTAKDIFNAGLSIKNGATSAGFIEFFEDSDNGTNKVTLVGAASTADVTLSLPAEAGVIASEGTATALAIALG